MDPEVFFENQEGCYTPVHYDTYSLSSDVNEVTYTIEPSDQLPGYTMKISEAIRVIEPVEDPTEEEVKTPIMENQPTQIAPMVAALAKLIDWYKPLRPNGHQQLMSHLLVKDGSYNMDELFKKIMRKLVESINRDFLTFQNEHNDATTALLRFLEELGYPETVGDEELHVLKQVFFSLNQKRNDPNFGSGNRGKNGRNDFMEKGTKKTAIVFFKYGALRFLLWGDFERAVDAMAKNMVLRGDKKGGKAIAQLADIKVKVQALFD